MHIFIITIGVIMLGAYLIAALGFIAGALLVLAALWWLYKYLFTPIEEEEEEILLLPPPSEEVKKELEAQAQK